MAVTSISLGYPAYCDGMQWTSLLSRTFVGGAALWDANTSLVAVNPLGGVFPGAGNPLQVTQQASPNMTVLVNAGYCAVPSLTQGHGAYLFGMLAQGTLTVASNPTGSSRTDIVIARVYDLGSSSSYCDVEIIEGTPGLGQPATPGTSILLATVTVPSSATSIVTADITDLRTWTAAPGGMLPVSSVGAAPPLGAGQIVWNTGQQAIERAASTITETFTFGSAGTYTQGLPDGTIRTIVQGWAAGAGGGGSSDNASGGGGGGGGEYFEDDNFPASGGDVLQITVGAGGTGSAPEQDDSTAGGSTTVTYGATSWTANGGTPGKTDSANDPSAVGQGGTGSTAPIHYDGGDGGEGDTVPVSGGGGGGSGGPGSPGNDGGEGGDPRNGVGGYGARAVPGGGPGGQGGNYYGDGQTPYTGPGGGGGGTSGIGNYSGNGADGQVIVTCIIQPSALTALAGANTELASVDTSTGTAGSSGLNAGDTASAYGWGIGYGTADGPSFQFDTDNGIIPEMQATFTADGSTDFQFDVKWGMAVPEAAVDSTSPSISYGQCRIILQLDGTTLDMVYLACSASGGVTHPGQPGSWTYYTSAANGTTPSSGSHTLTLAVETRNTAWEDNWAGAHVGDLASVARSPHPFGTVPTWFTSALTAENCSLRVAGILASTI